MSMLMRGSQWRAVLNAPGVALAYAAIGFAVVSVGCMPPFSDTEFFGVPVTAFLLPPLTIAALILIVFAGLGAFRTFRIWRRRDGSDDFTARQRVGVAGILLAVAAFGGTAWLGVTFLRLPCVA